MTTEKVGALILTSLLEDPDELTVQALDLSFWND